MGWPTAIIIGCMKCGTTPLIHNIAKHPEIRTVKNPEDKKKASTEIRFWNDGQPYHTLTTKGIDWYKSLFKERGCQVTKSANYGDKKSTMERISKHIPDVKLILCLREPIKRMYSEFQMQTPNIPFTIKLAEKRGYLNRSKYYKQITKNVLPFFPKENLYIIIQERIKNNTNEEMNKLYKFIGVSELDYKTKKVTSQEATDRNLNLKKDSEIKSYKVWKTKYKSMDSKLNKQLRKYFQKHNEKLFELLGYKIQEWE